jgi:hypothetical protein
LTISEHRLIVKNAILNLKIIGTLIYSDFLLHPHFVGVFYIKEYYVNLKFTAHLIIQLTGIRVRVRKNCQQATGEFSGEKYRAEGWDWEIPMK